MSWFSVGVPVLLQLLVPLGLLAAVVKARSASSATFVGMTILAAAYIVAIHRAGLWLVLPWFTPFAYAAALLTVVLTTQARWRAAPWRPATRSAQALTIGIGATALMLITLAAVAWSARDWSGDTVDLALPFEDGKYLVVNGGSHVLVNAHLATLNGNRFAAYRGQSYGVDLVRIDFLGLRARGLLPADPAAYRTFDEPVLAPCAGRVVAAVDGFPDMPPPQVDRTPHGRQPRDCRVPAGVGRARPPAARQCRGARRPLAPGRRARRSCRQQRQHRRAPSAHARPTSGNR